MIVTHLNTGNRNRQWGATWRGRLANNTYRINKNDHICCFFCRWQNILQEKTVKLVRTNSTTIDREISFT
jgi:hypothetical protein